MKIQNINKTTYRKHLNQIIIGFIVVLLCLSLFFGSVFVYFWGVSPEQIVNGESNFRFNLLGVILALISCSAILYNIRTSEFFKEVYYVWQMKQVQNLIYRKLRKITSAAKYDDVNALIILHYYYESLIHIYQLDDNTITLNELIKKQQAVEQQIEDKKLNISSSQFDKSLLTKF
ncbi:DUF3087 family protein [Thalassotalea profundi]|uniref:DUF3087 domain-containing protein n=1 Tax=Thalassotalea profundi TaxID=2036687 RepID=A0ABQ3IQT5_9GAMM|nr:DUF3087 family protein [Thalassotalea profundi]GHE91120.1 DUF3087 domain-containing protein [Thalassotalea profundi]